MRRPVFLDKITRWLGLVCCLLKNKNIVSQFILSGSMSVALGIDFGTTHTTAAYIQAGTSDLKQILFDGGLFPSAVRFNKNGKPFACPKMNNKRLKDTAINPKRLIGRSYHSPFIKTIKNKCGLPLCEMGSCRDAYKESCIHEIGYVLPNSQTISAVDVSTEILKKVKQLAKESTGLEFNDAIITIPVQYTWEQRQETYRAAQNAGFNVRCLQYEPVMAAYAYCRKNHVSNGKFLIYDYGGGTFDAAVVRVENNTFYIEETLGDANSGGDDLTNSIYDELLKLRQMNLSQASDAPLSPESMFRLKMEAEKLKKNATNGDEVEVSLEDLFGIPGRRCRLSILTNEVRKRVQATVQKAQRLDQKHHADFVLMIGGSSAFFYCRQKMRESFGERLVQGVDVNYCVSQGAAMCTQELQVENAVPQIRNQLQCALGFQTMRNGVYYFCKEGDFLPQQYQKGVMLQRDADQLETIIVEKRGEAESLGGTLLQIKLNRRYPKGSKFTLSFVVKNDLLLYVEVQGEHGTIAAPMKKLLLHCRCFLNTHELFGGNC